MVTTEFSPLRPLTPGERLRQTAAAVLAVTMSAFASINEVARAWRNRRAVGSLLQWDDRMLADIGLTPGDVRSVMALPVAEDPSHRLGVLASERRAAERATAHERLRRTRVARL